MLLFVVNVLLVIRVIYRDGAIKLKRAYLIFKRRYDQNLLKNWIAKDKEREEKIIKELTKAQQIFEIKYKLS
jgi:hypothetical protein